MTFTVLSNHPKQAERVATLQFVKSQLPPLVRSLLDPRAYPDQPRSVEFVQTHISYVFLAGDYVYKLKKPVDFGFLDFSTTALRRHSCFEELRLNRRLSPDVYLGVEPIVAQGGSHRIGGAGEAVDWAVKMRRLPQNRMLESLIFDRAVPTSTGIKLGEVVGRFHLQAERGEHIAAVGGRSAVRTNWRENFDQVSPFRSRTIDPDDDDRIQAYVRDFMIREAALLAERDASGWIRDLHGDLRSAQIWALEEPPESSPELDDAERRLLNTLDGIRILDCIEFNERLRCCDTASDIAFLAMDLVFRRRRDLSRELLSRYLEVTSDSQLPLLLDFYSCYRAYVRGKVDSLAIDQREIDGRQRRRLVSRARRFFRLAARYALPPRFPSLVTMMGVSGSGKSHLARLIALERGAVLLSSDVIRKRLLGIPLTTAADPAAYTTEQTDRTYDALLNEASIELRRGHSVVLDATFLSRDRRLEALRLAQSLAARFALVWCQATRQVLEARSKRRTSDGFRVSDATTAVAREQIGRLQAPTELSEHLVLRVNSRSNPDRLLLRLAERLDRTATSGHEPR